MSWVVRSSAAHISAISCRARVAKCQLLKEMILLTELLKPWLKRGPPQNVPFLMQVISARFQKHASQKEMDKCVEKRAKSNPIGLWESANKIIPVPYFPSAWLVMCHQQNHLSQSSERDFKGTRLLPWLPSRWHYPKWIREALCCLSVEFFPGHCQGRNRRHLGAAQFYRMDTCGK